jgi:hypothetical protein
MAIHDFPAPAAACPRCGMSCDMVAAIGHEDRPSPGDGTLCAGCGSALQFTDDMGLVLMSPEQLALEIRKEPRIAIVMATLRRRYAERQLLH